MKILSYLKNDGKRKCLGEWKREAKRNIFSDERHYNPGLFLSNHSPFVDPFSLYLSLGSSMDERIESALSEMMEKIIG